MSSGILVSYAGYPVITSSLFPDNGLASLAGTLLAAGHGVRVLDFNTTEVLGRLVSPERSADLAALLPALAGGPDPQVVQRLLDHSGAMEEAMARAMVDLAEEIAREVVARSAQFVGFKLWSGDGFLASVRMAEALRRRFPKLKIYGGGPAVLYAEQAIYGLTDVFDALVDGEGEQAILGLAAHAEGIGDLDEVPNLILHDGTTARRTPRSLVPELDDLALPCYDPEVYPSLATDGQIKLFVLDESRGCPMGCAFCSHQSASGKRWRIKSPARVLREVQALGDRFGTTSIRLGGSYTPARFYSAFADLLLETKTHIQFCGFAHPQGLPLQQLGTLAEAGCSALFMGVESFDPGDLKRLGKRLDPERARATIRACLEAGIAPVVSVIMPVPGQTEEGLRTNRQALRELCAGNRSTVVTQFPILLPRTPWWEAPETHGFELSVTKDAYRQLVLTYQVRHLIPPALWEPLPYSIDGMAFAEYASANAGFQQELVREGIVVNVSDDMVLLADQLGETLPDFRARQQKMFFNLDASDLGSFVAAVNKKLTAS
jgi:radical SAM superfamily enzyme YgiQ (UPF0313 family)